MDSAESKGNRHSPLKWTTIIPETAWAVENVLTIDECQKFVDRATTNGVLQQRSLGDVRHRDSCSVTLHLPEMATTVYERIKGNLPQCVKIDETTDNLGIQNLPELRGTWRPYGLNPVWRIVCYPGSGHFGPHRDAARIEDEHHRSLLTLNGYLTDRPLGTGGATRFVKDDMEVHTEDVPAAEESEGLQQRTRFTTKPEDVLHKVESDKAGKAVIFFHDLMHDGEPLAKGSPPKWLFRSEVMFYRDPMTAPMKTAAQIQARKLLQQAEEAESMGNITESILHYKQAYRLDPTLEHPFE